MHFHQGTTCGVLRVGLYEIANNLRDQQEKIRINKVSVTCQGGCMKNERRLMRVARCEYLLSLLTGHLSKWLKTQS